MSQAPRPRPHPAFSDPDEAWLALASTLREDGYRFTTVTPASHALVNARPENAVARDREGIFGWSRPFRDGPLADRWLGPMRKAGVLRQESEGWRSAVRLSSLGDHLLVHSAFPTTTADAVFFGPDTYRFAAAIEAWLTPPRASRVRRAVDIGCGAGAGAMLVAASSPSAEVFAVDINDEALRLTRLNAAQAGFRNVVPVRSDLLGNLEGAFDLIVSNPPYLNDPLERAYRHGGGEFGAALSLRILDEALRRLAPGGTLLLYTGVAIVRGRDPFRQAAMERLADGDVEWGYREVDPDVFGEELASPAYGGVDRIAAVVLIATRRE